MFFLFFKKKFFKNVYNSQISDPAISGCVYLALVHSLCSVMNRLIRKQEETLKVNIKPGWKKGTKITFEGVGNEKPGYLPEDITFVVEEKRHPLFKRRGDDLEIAVEIPLVKALTGCKLSVPLLSGESMSVSVGEVIFHGFVKAIKGQGLPNAKEEGKRGDLRITFLVTFPKKLSEEQRSIAYEVLKDCSWA